MLAGNCKKGAACEWGHSPKVLEAARKAKPAAPSKETVVKAPSDQKATEPKAATKAKSAVAKSVASVAALAQITGSDASRDVCDSAPPRSSQSKSSGAVGKLIRVILTAAASVGRDVDGVRS